MLPNTSGAWVSLKPIGRWRKRIEMEKYCLDFEGRDGWPQPSALVKIGAVGPPRPTIFIRGGELEKLMGQFYENAVLVDGRAGDRRHLSRPQPRRSEALQHLHRPWRPEKARGHSHLLFDPPFEAKSVKSMHLPAAESHLRLLPRLLRGCRSVLQQRAQFHHDPLKNAFSL